MTFKLTCDNLLRLATGQVTTPDAYVPPLSAETNEVFAGRPKVTVTGVVTLDGPLFVTVTV